MDDVVEAMERGWRFMDKIDQEALDRMSNEGGESVTLPTPVKPDAWVEKKRTPQYRQRWPDVVPKGTEGDEDCRIFIALAEHPCWKWRSTFGLAGELQIPRERIEQFLEKYSKLGIVSPNASDPDQWGYWERIESPSPMNSIGETLDPNTFEPTTMRKSYDLHLRKCTMSLGTLPHDKIVTAFAEAIAHTREVAYREHIKADRNERVNQFIVSLRRQFAYIGDNWTSERQILSSQLSRKEVWYDIGVLNPKHVAGLTGQIRHEDVEEWLNKASVIAPSSVDLKKVIETDLQQLHGSIIVAESCNKHVGEMSKNADKIMSQMAALANDMID